MAVGKSKTFICIFVITLSKVMSWTVDLAEVQKVFEDNTQPEDYLNEYSVSPINSENEILYSSNYAETFKYGDLKRKEVSSLIQNGTVYLEGLSKALADYRETLDNCSRNSTEAVSEEQKTDSMENTTLCDKAMKNSEYVRKLSGLALLKTNQLRDKAYDSKFQDDDGEENELILQLAWTLDRLAYLTGYEPNPKSYIETSTGISTSTQSTKQATTENIQTFELLEQVENGRPISKTLANFSKDTKSVQKRDVNSPLENIAKYYVKYKVWNGSNLNYDNEIKDNVNFDVNNYLKVLPKSKRSVTPKKAINMRIKHAMMKLNKRIKNSKNGIRKLIKSIKIYRKKVMKSEGN